MKYVLAFSGGLDSTVLLTSLLSENHEVHTLNIDYGQRHKREVYSASDVFNNLTRRFPTKLVAHSIAVNPEIFSGSKSSLVSLNDVPEGHYSDETMQATVVPNRNMIFLSLAGALAMSINADKIAIAAHAGDHAIYPDCRIEFYSAMEKAFQRVKECDDSFIHVPFVTKSKAEIVKLGNAVNAPMVLSYSCYNGQDIHCGRCGTCVERAEAFALAGVTDLTQYEDSDFWKSQTEKG